MDKSNVSVKIEGFTGIITIDNPESLNALDNRTLDSLSTHLSELAADKSLRALIIIGTGRAFIAGADISAMENMTPDDAKKFAEQGSQVFMQIQDFPTPVIAAINGYALGGGCELSLACDIRIASENAKIGQPEVSLGIIPGFSGTVRLPEIIGIAAAKEMIFTGKIIDASTALSIGLVNKVVPADHLMDVALETAKSIGDNSPHAVSLSKKALNSFTRLSFSEAVKIENQYFSLCFANKEQQEGMRAFMEKRKPSFNK
jgi:enoyl-CoA hydratase